MSINTSSSDDIIYAVDDKPGVTESFFAALAARTRKLCRYYYTHAYYWWCAWS